MSTTSTNRRRRGDTGEGGPFRLLWLLVAGVVCALLGTTAFAQEGGPGIYETELHCPREPENAGVVRIWNSRDKLYINVRSDTEWRIQQLRVWIDNEEVPTDDRDRIEWREFPWIFKYYKTVPTEATLVFDLQEDLGFGWGRAAEGKRVFNVCVLGFMAKLEFTDGLTDADIAALEREGETICRQYELIDKCGGWGADFAITRGSPSALAYKAHHPDRGRFVDAAVQGLGVTTPTYQGRTDSSGGFDFFPGEEAEFTLGDLFLGTALADRTVTPLDLFDGGAMDDNRVANVARLLQSLDSDGNPKNGITIADEVINAVDDALNDMGLTGLDFGDDQQVDEFIDRVIAKAGASGTLLTEVSAADALIHLDAQVGSTVFRKNISKEPEFANSKQKLDIAPVYVPAMKADGTAVTLPVVDENGDPVLDDAGVPVVMTEAKPLVVTYLEEVEPESGMRMAFDVFTAVSRDDGLTWKRTNISRTATISSFDLQTGEAFPGNCRAPTHKVIGNKILVAWTSTYARGGKPRYSIDPDDDYTHDDAYYVEDIWGVRGSQSSVDYDEVDDVEDQGIGEIPYYALWTARGVIVTQADLDAGKYVGSLAGDIIWYKPERLTSARRDAFIQVTGGANGAGFAVAWQEDPDGLRPGKGKGTGAGWSGAISNHTTDIWYSHLRMQDFDLVDTNFVSGSQDTGDPDPDDAQGKDPDVLGRLKVLVPMSLPVRISDNDMVNTDNLNVALDGSGYPTVVNGSFVPVIDPDASGSSTGTRRYAYLAQQSSLYSYYDWASYELADLTSPTDTSRWFDFTNNQDVFKRVVVTLDGRRLDGDTGASRANLSLQPYTKADGTKSAYAILGYEETKGLGAGHEPGEDKLDADDYGKDVIYHSFDFLEPDLVSGGDKLNLPARDDDGNLTPIYEQDTNGNDVFLQYKTEVARRVRFLVQAPSKVGPSGTAAIVLYKQGRVGQGNPADVMIRRIVVPQGYTGNPYAFENFVFTQTDSDPAINGQNTGIAIDGHVNLTSVTVDELYTNDDNTADGSGDNTDPGTTPKIIEWHQEVANLSDESFDNPLTNGKGHRGFMRGDFVVIGYSWTANWAAASHGRDKYDFYIRRSFDGGLTWTNKPAAQGGTGTTHTLIFNHPDEDDKRVVTLSFGAGEFEQARNISQLKNSKETVMDPRLVGSPGTIKGPGGAPTGYPDDLQDDDIFYFVYGTGEVVPTSGSAVDHPESEPLDLFYTFTRDSGETFYQEEWVVNPDSSSSDAGTIEYRNPWLANNDPRQGEAQLRLSPAGGSFYAVWHQYLAPENPDSIKHWEGDDVWFRKIVQVPVTTSP